MLYIGKGGGGEYISKSSFEIVLCLKTLHEAVVAEWLRRLTRKACARYQIPFGGVGSNPTNCDLFSWKKHLIQNFPKRLSSTFIFKQKAVVAERLRRLTRSIC